MQSVWLFTCEPESVRLSVQPGGAVHRLTILGPGAATAAFEFADSAYLERFRETYAQDLLARGFTLQVVTERRDRRDDAWRAVSAERRRPRDP